MPRPRSAARPADVRRARDVARSRRGDAVRRIEERSSLPENNGFKSGEAERLLRQRTALAEFGAEALSGADLDRVLDEGARLCAEGLGVPFCKVLEPRPGEDGLLVRAGVGWEPGVVGRAVVPADAGNPGGASFRTGRPVVVSDLREVEGMDLPDIYPRHGIVASANVPIAGEGDRPYGVLEVDAREPRGFGQDDIDFLRGYAKVMAGAVRARRRDAALRAESEARAALLREQQHRMRNNLTAITAMLQGGERKAADEGSRARFREVRRRVFSMASLYDHLLGAGLSGEGTSLRDYLAALCAGAGEFHDLAARGIALSFEADGDAPPMGIDACTVVGIVVNELVANAVEHAFGPGAGGRIAAGLVRDGRGGTVVTVADDGMGIPAGAEGRSVGLGVARRLAEQIGASLSLRSGPGRTVWTIALPGGLGAEE
jgi:two-component sensor histidine kinase